MEENYEVNLIVNFMLIGAQKAGTTSLSYQLAQHPQIEYCKHKEPDFFSKTKDWRDKLPNYHALYNKAPGKIYGEGSTTYTWIPEYPETARRIHAYNPNIKLIYIMRHPVERTISHYFHHYLKARTKYSKEEEILNVPTYLNHSSYAMQLRPYFELFSKAAILPVIFEEFIEDPFVILNQIAHYLDIDPDGFNNIDTSPQYQSVNRKGERKIKKLLTPFSRLFPLKVRNALRGPFVFDVDSKIEFSSDFKKLLWRFFQDDVYSLERMIERNLDIWRKDTYD